MVFGIPSWITTITMQEYNQLGCIDTSHPSPILAPHPHPPCCANGGGGGGGQYTLGYSVRGGGQYIQGGGGGDNIT